MPYYLGSFLPEFQKTIAIFEIDNAHLPKCIVSFSKNLSLSPKLSYLDTFQLEFGNKFRVKQQEKNFNPKMLDLETFRSVFEKTIFIFEFSTLKFVKMQRFL